ncbi:MAG: ParM/StbA family protein [Eubacteriaceae bacterium]|nr:ParM/StbA family protein [Eubacteriaceae bacterium]
MDKQLIMGIDHGNSQIKTAHCCFTASVREYTMGNAMQPEILELHGKQYFQSSALDPTEIDKTETDRYYLLTLFAIAREIDSRKLSNTDTYHLYLGIGFPPGFYDEDGNKKFRDYLTREKEVIFIYNKRKYHIVFEEIFSLLQGVAALYAINPVMQNQLRDQEFACIDIGGWTVDYIAIDKGFKENLERIYSMSGSSVNRTADGIKRTVLRKYRYELTYENINSIINKEKNNFEEDIQKIVQRAFKEAAEKIIIQTQSIGIDLKHYPVFLTGGGAKYMHIYFKNNPKVVNVFYVDNINLNAIGYEKIVDYALSQRK